MTGLKFKKCYFLAPTRYFKPDKRIRLGNIVISSSAPDQPLNIGNQEIDLDDIEETEETKGEMHESLENAVKAGVSTSFLQMLLGASIDANVENSTTETNKLDWDKVIVQEFGPSAAFLEGSIKDEGVNKYLQKKKHTWLGESPVRLYMITGVKIASGSNYCSEVAKKRALILHSGVDATPVGVPLDLGANIDISREKNSGQSSKVEEPFVLGFRLKRMKISPKGEIEIKDHTDGTVLGDDGQSTVEKDIEFSCESLGDEDATGNEFGQEEIEGCDYDGAKILIVNPSEE